MIDYSITINTEHSQRTYEFRYDHIKYEWIVFINKTQSQYTIKMYQDNDMTYYDLCRHTEPIKMFEFDFGGLGYISNSIEIILFIMKD